MAVDRTELAVGISPFVPDSHSVFLEVMHVGIAAQKPQQLVDYRLEVQLLGGEQGESLAHVEAHLVSKNAYRTGSGAVVLLRTLGEDAVQEV